MLTWLKRLLIFVNWNWMVVFQLLRCVLFIWTSKNAYVSYLRTNIQHTGTYTSLPMWAFNVHIYYIWTFTCWKCGNTQHWLSTPWQTHDSNIYSCPCELLLYVSVTFEHLHHTCAYMLHLDIYSYKMEEHTGCWHLNKQMTLISLLTWAIFSCLQTQSASKEQRRNYKIGNLYFAWNKLVSLGDH